jgi:autotransporter-associated beta strand protein
VFANGTLSVTPATVIGSITALDKTYDGSAAATISSRSLSGVLFGDDTTLTGGTASFPNKNAGINLTVTATGLTISGTTVANYTLASSTVATTATINQRALTVTAGANTKPYDGTTSAATIPAITSGTVAGGDTAAFIETYDTPNAGTGKTLTPSGSVTDGNGGANYAVTFVNNVNGVINAGITYWDPTGTTGSAANTSGTWEGSFWSSAVAGIATPIPFPDGNLPVFSAGVGGNGNTLTITANANHIVAGVFNGGIVGDTYSTNLTINGPGILSIASGLQGFSTTNNANTTINAQLAGTGALQNQSGGSLFLYGNNTYSGGTSLGTSAGLNFNNNNSFGTGPITNAVSLTVLATPAATGPITIANAVQTYGLGGQFIITGLAVAPVNFTGPWTLVGSAGTTALLDVRTISGATATWTISGPISGAANLHRTSATATLVLSGANTYTGQTVVRNGTLSVSSLNKVAGGNPSSNLGAPATVANGTIGLGTTTTTGTLIYTGAGETTDRVLNLVGTTGGGVLENDGTGPITFTSACTASGAGVKTFTLQGSNTGANSIGAIVNSASATALTKAQAGTWILTGANTYTGATTVSGGTLGLGVGGSIGLSAVTVASGAALANVTSGTRAIGGATTLSTGGKALFTAAGGPSSSIGKLAITGNLTLNNNTITVNVTGASLAVGSYRLADCTGTLAGSANATPTMTGIALGAGYTAAITTTAGAGGHVDLLVKATPVFSSLIASPSVSYGTSSITLTGRVSNANGPSTVYPGIGEFVSASINGHLINGTVVSAFGEFSVTYNDPSLATDGVAGSPYVVTYGYAGNGTLFLNAANDASTSLTVTPAALTVTANSQSKTYGQTLTFGSGSSFFTSSGLKNGETIGSVTLACAGGPANSPVSGSPYTITPSAATGGTFNANNYAITYNTGTLTVNPSATATALVSSVNPSGPGTNVTFTATLSGAPPTPDLPTGNVVFSANGTPFATNALISGSASASTASLPLGTNAMTAQYIGDGNFLASSAGLDQVVKNFITYSATNVLTSIVNNNNGTFTLNLLGTPDSQYYVVASADITVPIASWTPLVGSTNAAPGPSGIWSLVVSNSAPAYYRSVAVNPAP